LSLAMSATPIKELLYRFSKDKDHAAGTEIISRLLMLGGALDQLFDVAKDAVVEPDKAKQINGIYALLSNGYAGEIEYCKRYVGFVRLTSPVSPEVLKAFKDFIDAEPGNPNN
jgi:hypothetical protein